MYIDLLDLQYEIDRFRNKPLLTRKRFIITHLTKCYRHEKEVNSKLGKVSELEMLVEIYEKLKVNANLHTFSESQLERRFYSKHNHSGSLCKEQFKHSISSKYANQIPYLFLSLALTEQDLVNFTIELKLFTRSRIDSLILKLDNLKGRV